jgi:cyclophilin family peptidyl-prolyl cis-trans isomerase
VRRPERHRLGRPRLRLRRREPDRYKDSTGLPPAYTPFGKVTAGLDVLQAIAAKGIAGGGSDGAPAQTVTVNSIRVKG